jgi:hypothetical protein
MWTNRVNCFSIASEPCRWDNGAVKANLKPPNEKARALFRKLQALAERGVDGEKISAQKKLARLKARFDFAGPNPSETPDLFHGNFKRASKARFIYAFGSKDFDIANSVKWAIETATNIQCVYREGDLLAEATPSTANRLVKVATHIACSFRTLVDKFSAIGGLATTYRSAFVMGLYDGMMNDSRNAGQRLPSRAGRTKVRKGKKPAVAAAELHVHPYTVALSLGRQIRFSAPLEEITAELEAATQKRLEAIRN